MDSAKSPRQFLHVLCAAWRRYVALPHGRANMDDLKGINLELSKMRPDSLLANKASRGNPRYYLLLGQLILDADALELAAAVLEATAQRVTSDGCNATAALSTVMLVGYVSCLPRVGVSACPAGPWPQTWAYGRPGNKAPIFLGKNSYLSFRAILTALIRPLVNLPDGAKVCAMCRSHCAARTGASPVPKRPPQCKISPAT